MSWSSTEQYEAVHGTQEAQAKAQASVGSVEADGPWRLVRYPKRRRPVILDNSVRSTIGEARRLLASEMRRTGIKWNIEKITTGEQK